MTLEYLKTMRDNYQIKLDQLKTFGKDNRIPERITETESSIELLNNEILKLENQHEIL